ncbi:MAG: acetylgalactosaminidase [Bacteroidetes bacterium]|nr:acetylgalactosaminidase [Bacteroidota bacterium]
MSTNRRKFLRQLAAGSSLLASADPALAALADHHPPIPNAPFNMCGYGAPKLDVVRVGVVGLGMRGSDAVERLSYIEGVEIVALCDKYPDRVEAAQQTLIKMGRPKAVGYAGEEGWKALCDEAQLDLVYTPTPWHLHTPIALRAMKAGKHAAVEVPAAQTLEDCWSLVETSEKTQRHCMMLENCCYDFFELLTLNMARNGLFGELVHAEGAYIHDLSKDWLFNKKAYADQWRLKENINRNGSLYPTHGIGPIAQCFNINRGDRMEYLTSISTADFSLAALAAEKAKEDEIWKPLEGKSFRGNMNTTLIRTVKGKTMMIQHDVSTPRPYSRIHLLSGTKGMAQKWPAPQRIAFGHSPISKEEFTKMEEKYTPPIVKHIGNIAKEVGGHGGMDFIMDWRLIDCLRNGLPLDQDVYDAAAWSSIVPLSERSVKKRGNSIDVPDFTHGAWKTNSPVSLSLDGGANTGVRPVIKQS